MPTAIRAGEILVAFEISFESLGAPWTQGPRRPEATQPTLFPLAGVWTRVAGGLRGRRAGRAIREHHDPTSLAGDDSGLDQRGQTARDGFAADPQTPRERHMRQVSGDVARASTVSRVADGLAEDVDQTVTHIGRGRASQLSLEHLEALGEADHQLA
jgi:hypothetical protein